METIRYKNSYRLDICRASDVNLVRLYTKEIGLNYKFDSLMREEIALVASELATNILKHAKNGLIILTPLFENNILGIQIDAYDKGPGIDDIESALTDGFSTTGSLGLGLGTINRLMDYIEILKPDDYYRTKIRCRRWQRSDQTQTPIHYLDIGIATQVHPRSTINGDEFIIKRWKYHVLIGVIDGLGHGQYAQRAAKTAREYIERHFDQSLDTIFRGTERACRATRGVGMALARIDWQSRTMEFASIGNIEAQFVNQMSTSYLTNQRGVVGFNSPSPSVVKKNWHDDNALLMHSDGVKTHWKLIDFLNWQQIPAPTLAYLLLRKYFKGDDDATLLIVKPYI